MSCSNCDLAPATRVWDKSDAYPVCETCWVDMAESEAEIYDSVVCEECHHKPATKQFLRLDGVLLDLCSWCWSVTDHEPISSSPCQMCSMGDGHVRAAHPMRLSDGKRIYVCTECFETSQNKKAPIRTICEDCDQKFAMIVVTQDEKTTIDVCEGCYEAHWAPKAPNTHPVKDDATCDACYERPATIEWHCEDDGNVYPYCDECWKELCDGADELRKERKSKYVLCDTCKRRPFTTETYNDDDTLTLQCNECYEESLVSSCEDCGCPTTNVVERKDEDVYVCEYCATRYHRMFEAPTVSE
jgi:hypothetical protein